MSHQAEIIKIENVEFSIITVKEIADRLPKSSWLAEKADEYAEEVVFFHEGNVELSILRLGEMPEWSLGYVIMGDLLVERIIEASDDLAMGLVVDGNLTVDYIRAGGNEIYVSGNMKVNGLFFGKYSHGSLIVEGETYANAFIADDYLGSLDSSWSLTDDECFEDEEISEDEYAIAVEKIIEAIRPEFILNFDNIDEPFLWAHVLDYPAIEEAMKHHLPILQDSFVNAYDINFLTQPAPRITIEIPEDFIVKTVEDIVLELSTDSVENLAKTITGLPHQHFFIPQTLYNVPQGLSLSFSEGYPERFFIDSIAARSNYQGKLPYGVQLGMTRDALVELFGDQYSEKSFEEYDDSLEGIVELGNIRMEMLIENNIVTYVKYQVSEQ